MSYSQVRLGCNSVFKEIISTEMYWFYENNRGGLYPKPLDDSERPRQIGRLTYSGHFSEALSTQRIINNALKENNQDFQIGVKVRKADSRSMPGCKIIIDNTLNWINRPHMTLALEADQSVHLDAKTAMIEMFNNRNHPPPGGLYYRFLPSNSILMISQKGSKDYSKTWDKHCETVKKWSH